MGDRYVLEEMQRIGANLGGEQSGHILFLDDATTGDGMLTAVKMASVVSIAGPLEGLVADLKVFPQKIVNVRVKSKPPLDSLPEVTRLLSEAERALGDSGRVVLRYSGTEALARVMVSPGLTCARAGAPATVNRNAAEAADQASMRVILSMAANLSSVR